MKPPKGKMLVLVVGFFFFLGCTSVKQVVTDVKEGVQGIFKKEDTQKPPAEAEEAKPPQEPEKATQEPTKKDVKEVTTSPAKPKPKETKPTATPKKKSPPQTTPIPSGEVFGPK